MQIPRWPLATVPLAVLLALGTPLASWAQPAPGASVVLNTTGAVQPLSQALTDLARQSRLTLVVAPALLAGKNAPNVSGRFTPQQAMERLLAGSGLSGRIEAGALTVRPLPPPAPATPAPQADAIELPTVLVTAEREQALPNAATVNTVTREELDRLPPTSTSDIFKGIPGVTAANARNGASFDLNVRGQQGDRVKVLVDGTQSTSNTSKSYGGENNHNYVDPDLVSSIVVEKGPNTGPHGTGTGGGVVNLTTLSADDLLRDGKNWGLRLRGGWANNASEGQGFRTYNNTGPIDVRTPNRNVSASVAGAWRGLDGKLDLVAAHSQRRSSNYHAGSKGHTTFSNDGPLGEQRQAISLYKPGLEVFNTSQDTQSTLLKARLQLPADQWIELSHNQFESTFGESRITAFDYNIEQKLLTEVEKSTSLLRYGWKPAGNPFWNLRANLWNVKLDELHPEITYGASGTTTTQGLEVWNSSLFDLAGLGLTLAYGGSLQNEKTTGLGITEPRGERELSSLFVRAEAQFNEHVALEAGLRREAYTAEGTGSFISPIPGQSRIPYAVADGHHRVNPSVALTIKPVESTAFFVRYSEGWRHHTERSGPELRLQPRPAATRGDGKHRGGRALEQQERVGLAGRRERGLHLVQQPAHRLHVAQPGHRCRRALLLHEHRRRALQGRGVQCPLRQRRLLRQLRAEPLRESAVLRFHGTGLHRHIRQQPRHRHGRSGVAAQAHTDTDLRHPPAGTPPDPGPARPLRHRQRRHPADQRRTDRQHRLACP